MSKMEIILLHERCEDALPKLEDASVDVIITDPPYGTTKCSWDIALDMKFTWKEYLRILKPDGAILIFSAQPFTSQLIQSCPELFRYV